MVIFFSDTAYPGLGVLPLWPYRRVHSGGKVGKAKGFEEHSKVVVFFTKTLCLKFMDLKLGHLVASSSKNSPQFS